jgi:hypothetical protein
VARGRGPPCRIICWPICSRRPAGPNAAPSRPRPDILEGDFSASQLYNSFKLSSSTKGRHFVCQVCLLPSAVGWVRRWVVRGTCTGVWTAIQAAQTSRLFALVNVANPNAPRTPLRAMDEQLFSFLSTIILSANQSSSVCANRPHLVHTGRLGWSGTGYAHPHADHLGAFLVTACIAIASAHHLFICCSPTHLIARSEQMAETHTHTQTAQPCQPLVLSAAATTSPARFLPRLVTRHDPIGQR